MSSRTRISRAYKTAPRISFNDPSKFILFSDCHRGDNSFADDFANNRNIYFHALKHYFNEGFTYCELVMEMNFGRISNSNPYSKLIKMYMS